MTNSEQEILHTAAGLVAAFGSNDLHAYFGSFADDATFIFHATDKVLESVEAYRREWQRWEDEEGFRVLSCVSRDAAVKNLGDVAVFTHRVHTTVSTHGGSRDHYERETIVFQRRPSGVWVGVHEHLSPDPGAD